jgi:hypothetical protein
LGAIWIENSEPIGRDGRNPLNFFEKMERMDRIYIEILSIRIAGFLVRVQVEELLENKHAFSFSARGMFISDCYNSCGAL